MLLKAVRRMLRPAVRLMMRNGITFPVLADLLRTLYVEVAVKDVLTGGKAQTAGRKAQTDSRISLVTGVHRKEIRRLREQEPGRDDVPEVLTVASQIIARWAGVPAFAGADGKPRPLPRVPPPDGGPSFEALIASVTTDIRPRAVLDDWIGQGIVTLDDQDRVCLDTAAFIPAAGGEEQLFFFGRNLHDHVAASVANISAQQTAPFFDRSLHYDGLTPEAARRLEAFAREAGMKALLDANRLALELTEGAPSSPAGLPARRVNFGVYIYSADDAA